MENKEKITLTGDRPTGRLHLGHYVGSIKNRIKLQDEASKSFYMVADVQGLTDNVENPEKIRDNVLEVVLDNLACGLDPKKTVIYIQSMIPEIAELTMFFLNLVTVARLEQNPTIKTEMKEKGLFMNDAERRLLHPATSKQTALDKMSGKIRNVQAGFLVYPVSQAADILIMKSNLIPVGADQKPMIEQTNEIVDSFNRIYKETFGHVNHLIGEVPRLVGTDGNAKMSKSLNNCIYLSDSDDEIKKKVMQAYTDPNHIHVNDPGKIEGNVVFMYLDIFDKDREGLEELKKQYKKGGLGDVVLKERLTKILIEIISPIRSKREELAKDKENIIKIIKEGNKKASEYARKTMQEVREAMKIDYM